MIIVKIRFVFDPLLGPGQKLAMVETSKMKDFITTLSKPYTAINKTLEPEAIL